MDPCCRANQTALDYTGVTLEDVQKGDYRARLFHPEDVERLREERGEALTPPCRSKMSNAC